MGKRGVPLTEDEQATIERRLEDGKTYGQIGREIGRAASTVARHAKSIGHEVQQSNLARTRNARETRQAVSAERRAELAVEAAEKMADAMSRLGEPSYVVMLLPGGKHGPPDTTVVEVPAGARDWRDQAGAVRSLQQTMLDLVKYDERGEGDGADVDRWIDEHVLGGDQ